MFLQVIGEFVYNVAHNLCASGKPIESCGTLHSTFSALIPNESCKWFCADVFR